MGGNKVAENMLEKDFKEIVEIIKNQINTTQVLIMSDANKRLIDLYFFVGSIVNDNTYWGNKFIKNLSRIIKIEYPNIKGFSPRNLINMRKFYLETTVNEKVQTLSSQIPWSHNLLIISKISDINERLWYMEKCLENGWSHDVLAIQIETRII